MEINKNSLLKDVLKIGKECQKCGHCCKFGTGFLAGTDAKKIAKALGIKEDELKEKLKLIAELEAMKAKWDAAVAYSDSGNDVAEEIVALFA